MTRLQMKTNRFARLGTSVGAGAPNAGKPKYASLTAGLLARKGEAVPATPYFAAEALDLYAERAAPGEDRSREALTEPMPEAAAPRAPVAEETSAGWHLRRLGLDLRVRRTPPDERPPAHQADPPPALEPAEPPREPKAPQDVVPEPEAPQELPPQDLTPEPARPVVVEPVQVSVDPALSVCAPEAPHRTEVGPQEKADQVVRFEASLPAPLFARLALAANRSSKAPDELMRAALEAYFEAIGIPKARLLDTH